MIDRWHPPRLDGRVAVVTGASRGGGRGIALALGSCKATVYVTGRSTERSGGTRGFSWTIDETARLVRARGGEAIPVRCDHTDVAQVKRLFDRVRKDHGRLDVLVNNVWGGYERNEAGLPPGPFWKQPLWQWEAMFEAGLRAHLLSSYFAIPIMLPRRRGLIINTIAWERGKYLLHLYYDLAKQAIRRLAYDLALELRSKGIAALALAPGFMRSELVLAAHREHPFDLGPTESTEYLGRAVASLAADPKVITKTGKVLTVAALAREYGFTDTDGRWVPAFRFPDNLQMD